MTRETHIGRRAANRDRVDRSSSGSRPSAISNRPLNDMRAVLFVVALACVTHAYVLPGTRPQEYNRGNQIDLKVVQLDSVRTQVLK